MENQKITEDLKLATELFWESIPTVWDRVRENLRSTATSELNITVGQFHVLRLIRYGKNTVGELANARQISPSAVSQLVDILVGKRYVTRQENQKDRRFIHLELTDIGAELLNTVYAENRLWIMNKLSNLTDVELQRMLEGLEPLKKAFL